MHFCTTVETTSRRIPWETEKVYVKLAGAAWQLTGMFLHLVRGEFKPDFSKVAILRSVHLHRTKLSTQRALTVLDSIPGISGINEVQS